MWHKMYIGTRETDSGGGEVMGSGLPKYVGGQGAGGGAHRESVCLCDGVADAREREQSVPSCWLGSAAAGAK